jgi:hypothetical protein
MTARRLIVIACALLSAGPVEKVRAQSPGAGGLDPAAAMRQSFAQVSGWITKSAELVPAEKYSYQPAKTVRTFGQMVGHVADGYVYYCGRAAGRPVQWSDAIANGRTDKATLLPKLKQALDICTAAHASGYAPPLVENLTHSHLHYGNLITYLRMLGLVPPSS